jgi:Mn2+/Fe2+ NRAMP family transporter
LFATFAAVVLQEMAARLGVVARMGLGDAVLSVFAKSRMLQSAAAVLIGAALLIGNAAYEGGNIAGAALGVGALTEAVPRSGVCAAIAAAAAALLVFGGYTAARGRPLCRGPHFRDHGATRERLRCGRAVALSEQSEGTAVPGFRVVALTILLIGATAAVTGAQPIEMILFAQFANGQLLPIVAAFLLYAANRGDLLGARVNGIGANIAGVLVIVLTTVLGIRALVRVLASV